ncbi:MAG: Gfo/Idh/MocA family oxidoreductase [Clostridia bacterium]|nr:Gfo/Idh/MocA family oxidoreductase [Clostridia bacterium]
MIKFGVIGTGWIAEEFVKGTQLVDGLEFSAVYSRSKEKGEKFASPFGGAEIFDNIDDFAHSDIDAVYIASPNSLHYSQSKLMLENGKHVLCEKPITVTPDEFTELLTLAKSKNLVYMEAIMYLHLPARKVLLEALKRAGKITTAHFDFSQLSSKYAALKRGELPNIFNPKFATGCLMDLGIYCIYPALEIFGEPENIIASSGFLSTGADGFGTAIFDYSDKQVTLTYSKVGQDRCGSMICGDEGTIILPSVSKLTEMKFIKKDGAEEALSPDLEKPVLMSYEAENFLKYIKAGAIDSEYEYFNKITLDVMKTIYKIRELANINFTN